MTNIQIPNGWSPRPYQRHLFNNFGYGKKYQRASVIWHRRAGKDSTVLNLTAREMFKRVGTYWHLFPQQNQARKAIWNGIDREGRKIIDQFLPPDIRKRKDGTEMLIETVNGSSWQMAGSDNYDSLVGSNPVGVVFSEWALADPAAWEYIRPILLENGGWAVFITTPRGQNHAYNTHLLAQTNPNWLGEVRTVDGTTRADGSPVMSVEALAEERADPNMSEAKFQQEYYCSFEADSEEQLIPSAYVADARKRTAVSHISDPYVLGVDVARFGDDRTVLFSRRGRDAKSTIKITMPAKTDLMTAANRIGALMLKEKFDAVFIDEGGLGGGVIDRLRELGHEVIGVNFGGSSDVEVDGVGECKDKRTAMWATGREWLKTGAIPDEDVLAFELLAPQYKFDASGRMVMESKESMKKRGVRSPDEGDALMLTFAYPVVARSIQRQQEAKQVEEYSPFGW